VSAARLVLPLLALPLLAPAVAAQPKKITPGQTWVGTKDDEKLKKLAPKEGVVVEAKEFEKLWKAWRPDEKVPQVDFTKEFVLVTLASGPNKPGINATVEDGKMVVRALQTLIGGPGFGYSLATFPREGIKSINGKEFPPKK
jgi:hypothetical protein